MVKSILAEQLVSTILETASKQVRALFAHKREKKELAEVIEEYRMRAGSIQSNVDLTARISNPYLIEELLAHCALGDITEEAAITIFVGENANQHARNFCKDFYDQLYMLISKTGTAEASPSQPGINQSLALHKQEIQMIGDIDRRISDLSSPNIDTQLALLQTVISSIESGSLDVSDLPTLIKKCNCSQAGQYLESYLALCRNDRCCAGLPDSFSKKDELIIPIVELALSTGNYQYALTTLNLTSFDSTLLKTMIKDVFISGIVPQDSVQIPNQTSLSLESFAKLFNSEMAYIHKAYTAAENLFSQLNEQMNPVARYHSAISALVSDAVYGRSTLVEHLNAAISESHDWMSVELFHQLSDALVLVCAMTNASLFENALQNAPKHLKKHLEAPKILLEVSQADTFEEALVLMARGGQCRSIPAFLEPAIKAFNLNTSCKGILAKEFLRNKDWLFESPVPFAFYEKELSDTLSYQEFLELGAALAQTPEYHLLAYDLFKDAEPELAEKHIGIALAKLREGMVNPLHSLPEVWVTYLVENGRSQDVVDIASSHLPVESLDTIKHFLAICHHVDESGIAFNRLLEILANSDVFDTRIPEYLAHHFASINDVPTAGRLALRAFRLHETEASAAIVANWCIKSSLELDEDVRAYIERTDTQMMNLVGADIAEAEGNSTRGDQLLIRAAFREGDGAERAVMAYAARHIGNTNGIEHQAIEQDTCVTIEAEDGTIYRTYFFSDSSTLIDTCVSGPAGNAFLVKTPTFIAVRGCSVGKTITIGAITGKILGIESAEAGLTRQGLEIIIAKDPRSIVIHADTSDDLLDQIANVMRPQNDSLECYAHGINVGEAIIYPGIETARVFGAPDNLEFTIGAVLNEDLPFRRYQFSCNSPIEDETTYLSSYSATVCLALLKPPISTLNNISARCTITESTARRLENECHKILEDCYTSPGKNALVEGRLALFNNDKASKQRWRDIVLCISELVNVLKKTVPSTRVPTFDYASFLCDNTAIDIQTSIDDGLTYVTEDCLEAQAIDATESLRRCSITALLIGCQEYRYLLTDFRTTMQGSGAQPVFEEDVVLAINAAVDQAGGD